MRPAQLAFAASLALGAIGLQTSQALANCAMPRDYQAKIEGNTVTVCAQGQCDAVGALLREDVATGTVVELSNCSGSEAGAYSACFVDECVPAGSYRYGLKSPYPCCSACCGTYYYGGGLSSSTTTDVTAQLGECTPTGEVPSAYAGKPPWDGKDAVICQYNNPYEGTGGSSSGTGGSSSGTGGSINGTGGAVSGTGGTSAATGGASGTGTSDQVGAEDDSGGCSVSRNGLGRKVLGIHALALAFGLLLTGRKRSRRS